MGDSQGHPRRDRLAETGSHRAPQQPTELSHRQHSYGNWNPAMNPQTQAAYLAESFAELDRALGHLEYSANACADLLPDEPDFPRFWPIAVRNFPVCWRPASASGNMVTSCFPGRAERRMDSSPRREGRQGRGRKRCFGSRCAAWSGVSVAAARAGVSVFQ